MTTIFPTLRGTAHLLLVLITCTSVVTVCVQSAGGASQHVLLNTIDRPHEIPGMAGPGTRSLHSEVAQEVQTASGAHRAIRFVADMTSAYSRPNIRLAGPVQGRLKSLSLDVWLGADANVRRVGIMVLDAEGESHVQHFNADWSGWKTLTMDFTADATFEQGWDQPDKSRQVDQPIGSVHLLWNATEEGLSRIVADHLVAHIVPSDIPNPPVSVELDLVEGMESTENMVGRLVVHNYSDQPVNLEALLDLQENATLSEPLPVDPILGSNHALGARSFALIRPGLFAIYACAIMTGATACSR